MSLDFDELFGLRLDEVSARDAFFAPPRTTEKVVLVAGLIEFWSRPQVKLVFQKEEVLARTIKYFFINLEDAGNWDGDDEPFWLTLNAAFLKECQHSSYDNVRKLFMNSKGDLDQFMKTVPILEKGYQAAHTESFKAYADDHYHTHDKISLSLVSMSNGNEIVRLEVSKYIVIAELLHSVTELMDLDLESSSLGFFYNGHAIQAVKNGIPSCYTPDSLGIDDGGIIKVKCPAGVNCNTIREKLRKINQNPRLSIEDLSVPIFLDMSKDLLSVKFSIFDSDRSEEVWFSMHSAILKGLFNTYSQQRGVSLKKLRFTYADKIIFLSSLTHDTTPAHLGIKDGGTVYVSIPEVASSGTTKSEVTVISKSMNKQSSSKGRRKKKAKGKRNTKPTQHYNILSSQEKLRQQHSRALSQVFEEAAPIFKSRRQQLDALKLLRTKPKEKNVQVKAACEDNQSLLGAVGTGGKAGKSYFLVRIGEVTNLYNSHAASQTISENAMIDLHGCTVEEALLKLNKSLPHWVDAAMEGSYPWVITVRIVCGCGHQLLSEAVEDWIRQNEKVSNAPKSLYC